MGPKRSAIILSPLVSAALLCGQAANAAVPQSAAQLDPLVALSALGTAGSAAAVCAGAQSTSAALAAGQAATAAPGGCVLPVPEAAVPPPAPETPPVTPLAAPAGFNVLPLLLGLAAVVAVAALVAGGHGSSSGSLQPVSPA